MDIFTSNLIDPGSVLQVEFDDEEGTNLVDARVISSLNYSGSFGERRAKNGGDGSLNIGFTGEINGSAFIKKNPIVARSYIEPLI